MISEEIKKQLGLFIRGPIYYGQSFVNMTEMWHLPSYPDHYITDSDLDGVALPAGILRVLFIGKVKTGMKAYAYVSVTETMLLTDDFAIESAISDIEHQINKLHA